MRTPSRRRALTVAVTGAAITALLSTTAASAHPHDDATLGDDVAKAVTLDNVMKRLQDLQKISDRNGGNRVASSPGHEKSTEYVYNTLKKVRGLNVEYEDFPFVYTETRTEKLQITGATPLDVPVHLMTYTASTPAGGLTAPMAVLPVNPDGSSGCTAADYAGVDVTGKIALVKRGVCSFMDKQKAAAAAGASAVVIYDRVADPNNEPLSGTLSTPFVATIPTVGVTMAVGEDLTARAAAGTVNLHLEAVEFQEWRNTSNVVAETKFGDKDNQVVLGSHLDSVAVGPGINDNGSGSAALLETAIQFSKLEDRPKNQLKFVWFSAEEYGLWGSNAYVASRSEAERKKIALMLNYDMIGSPNWAEFVYDGNDEAGDPTGSTAIKNAHLAYLSKRGVQADLTPFDGRSDYLGFVNAGIPAGGTFTGAEDPKTPEQAAKFGGTAGVAYDSCYHAACDTIKNIDKKALDLNADTMAYLAGVYANDTSSVNGKRKGNSGPPAP